VTGNGKMPRRFRKRQSCSPDGAKRNPGHAACEMAPDFASLRPGYD